MQNKVINNMVIANSVNGLLQTQKTLWESVQSIDSSITKNREQLKKNMEDLEKAEANISIRRHIYGAVNVDSIKKSLINIYDDLRQYIQTCGSALCTTNKNLSLTLGLIRLLAIIEKDLYEQLDNETIQGNVLRELIRDWCKKNNIRDEEVNQLLEVSFQRAYTLRDRIKDVRVEVRSKFRYYDTELENLSTNVESLKSYISIEKERALEELSKLYSVKESKLDKFSTEKKNELIRLNKQNVQAANELYQAIDTKMKEILELQKLVEVDIKSTQTRMKEQVASFEVTIKDFIENQKKEYDSMMDSHQDMLLKVIEKTNSTAKRWSIGGIIVGAVLATAISYIVSMFL